MTLKICPFKNHCYAEYFAKDQQKRNLLAYNESLLHRKSYLEKW